MNYKAKIDILSIQNVESNIVVETNVDIRGIIRKKRFTLPKGSNNDEIKQHIKDKLIEEENRNVVGEKFEVDL